MAAVRPDVLKMHLDSVAAAACSAAGGATISVLRASAAAQAAEQLTAIPHQAQILAGLYETGNLRVCILGIVMDAHSHKFRRFRSIQRPAQCLANG